MGYRIEYGSGEAVTYLEPKSRGNRLLLTGCFFLLFCAVASSVWPGQWQRAKDYLIPGDPAVTKAAFSGMTGQLRLGETLEDAVVAFCREVVDGADPAD